MCPANALRHAGWIVFFDVMAGSPLDKCILLGGASVTQSIGVGHIATPKAMHIDFYALTDAFENEILAVFQPLVISRLGWECPAARATFIDIAPNPKNDPPIY